jgi:hypothetical protein
MENESYWTKLLRYYLIYHKDKSIELDGTERINDTFIKTFAFWKLFLIFFFLLVIGFINLGSKYEETINYMDKKTGYFFAYEFLLLFGAFLISTVVMYVMRLGRKVDMKQIGITSLVLGIFCIFKHLSFELSGLYRMKFGSDACNEEHNNKHNKHKEDNNQQQEEHFDPETCNKCDTGLFTGLLWDGLGKYGLGFTAILLLFFGISFFNPEITKNVFNFEFTRVISGICLLCIGCILIGGCFMHKSQMTEIKECKDKECKKKCTDKECEYKCESEDIDIFSMIKNGCAMVSVVFLIIITLALPGVFFISLLSKAPLLKELNKPSAGTSYNCYYDKGFSRFFLIIIESIIIYIIFSLAEAGIECLRKGEKFLDLMNDKKFWINTWSSALGIFIIQILLEYTDWFKSHLFTNDQLKLDNCTAKATYAAASVSVSADIRDSGITSTLPLQKLPTLINPVNPDSGITSTLPLQKLPTLINPVNPVNPVTHGSA